MSDFNTHRLKMLLKGIIECEPTEEGRWVLLETLCLGIGKFHGRTARETAVFVELIAERLASGERGE
jgi:hypothetical protein